jgi:hypothetical protein
LSLDEKLVEINFEELAEMNIASGDIFWKKSSGKMIPLCLNGDRIDHAYFDKFKSLTTSFWINTLGDEEQTNIGVNLLLDFKNAETDYEKVQAREKLIAYLKPLYWNEGSNGSLLDFVMIFNKVFYSLNQEEEDYLINRSMTLYRRSTLTSATIVLFAMCVGYLDYGFLKDLYHVCFYMDSGIEKSQFTINTMTTFEKERIFPGARKESLSESDAEIIENHTLASREEVDKATAYKFKNKGIKRLINFHHERLIGDGFPIGVNSEELSDLEKIVIMVFQNISYEEIKFSKSDGENFLNSLLGDVDQGECEARLKKQIFLLFGYTKNEDKEMGAA